MSNSFNECDEDIKDAASKIAKAFVDFAECDKGVEAFFKGGIAAALDAERQRHLPPPPEPAKVEVEEK